MPVTETPGTLLKYARNVCHRFNRQTAIRKNGAFAFRTNMLARVVGTTGITGKIRMEPAFYFFSLGLRRIFKHLRGVTPGNKNISVRQ